MQTFQITIDTTISLPRDIERKIAHGIEELLEHASAKRGNQQDYLIIEVSSDRGNATAKWDDRYLASLAAR